MFARLGDLGPFGQGDLTVEAVVYGAVIALKVMLLMLVTTLASLAVDPDELLRRSAGCRFARRSPPRCATRMIPLLAADAQRLAEAQRTRPMALRRRRAPASRCSGAVVGGSLDRAMDVAATLELRGFARHLASSPRAAGMHVRALRWLAPRLAFACSAVGGPRAARRSDGSAARRRSSAYPLVHMPVEPPRQARALRGALVVVLFPFCDRRGIEP